jgi:hypothetical protein
MSPAYMKVLKWILISLILIVALTVLAVFLLITFYKKDLSQQLIQDLQKHYGVVVQMSDVQVSFLDNWPHASVDFNDVVVRSAYAPPDSPPLLTAKSLAIALDLKRLRSGQIVVRHIAVHRGIISMLKDRNGETNFNFHKTDTLLPATPSSPAPAARETQEPQKISFEIRNVHLKDCQFVFTDQIRRQDFNVVIKQQDVGIRNYKEGLIATVKGRLRVNNLTFNQRRGAFLKNKDLQLETHVLWNKDLHSFFAMPGAIATIDKEKYPFWLLFENGGQKRLAFSLHLPQANYDKVAELLPPGIASVMDNFNIKKTLSASILLVTNPGQRQEPAFILDFEGKNQSLTIGNSKVPYSNLYFKARMRSIDSSRTKGDLEHATLMIYPLKGNFYNFPFTGRLKVSNLADPFLEFGGQMDIKAETIDFKVARDFVLQGRVLAQVSYSGPAAKLNAHSFLDKPMRLRSRLQFKNLSYREFNRTFTYVVNGLATLNNRDLQFDSLRLKTIAGEAILKGKADDFMAYLLGHSNGFKARLAARAEVLDLNPLFSEKSSPPPAAKPAQKEDKKKNQKEEKSNKEKLSEGGLNHFEFNVQLFARKMLIKKVVAEYANADLYYKNNFLNIKALSVNACDGRIIAHGTLSDFTQLRADLSVNNVDVTKMFSQFDNFGQDAVHGENLRGILSCEAKVITDLDDKFEIIPSTLKSDVRLRLRDGHLVNFEPLQNMSNLVFRNRDFNDISFSEITENFHFEGFKMTIEELEVASSVLNFFVVDGLYNFKGVSNINLLVPWSNLKKRSKNFIPKSSGESAGNTKGLKLNYRGPSRNMRISFGHQSSAGL